MFFIYILYSPRLQRYHVGSTKDIEQRLREHNAGKTHSTRLGVPWQLVLSESFPTRSEAVKQEYRIKARGIRRYLEDIGHAKPGESD